MLPRPPRRGLVPWRTLRKLQISGFRNQVVSERRELASRLSMFSRLCRVRCGQGFLNASSGLLGAGLPRLAVTNFSRPKPVFESRSRFRQVSYAVTDQQRPESPTRLKHAAESSLKHPEHDHVKREPGGPSPDERKLQNNFPTRRCSSCLPRIIQRPENSWVKSGFGSETGRPETPGLGLASQRRRTGRYGGSSIADN